MGKRPKLSQVDELFKKGIEFKLTDAEYESKTGCPLPKDTYYLQKKSALAKLAMQNGYDIQVIEKQVIFRKK